MSIKSAPRDSSEKRSAQGMATGYVIRAHDQLNCVYSHHTFPENPLQILFNNVYLQYLPTAISRCSLDLIIGAQLLMQAKNLPNPVDLVPRRPGAG